MDERIDERINKIKRFVIDEIDNSFYRKIGVSVCLLKDAITEIMPEINAQNNDIVFVARSEEDNEEHGCIIKNQSLKRYFIHDLKFNKGKKFLIIYKNAYSSLRHILFISPDLSLLEPLKDMVKDLNKGKTPNEDDKQSNTDFKNLPSTLVTYAKQQLNYSKDYPSVKKNERIRFESNTQLFQYYKTIQKSLPPSTQSFINSCFVGSSCGIVKEKEKVTTLLSYNSGYLPEKYTPEEFKQELDHAIEGNESAKNAIIDCISLSKRSVSKKGFSVLLIGPPGTGRNLLVETISKKREKPYIKIPFYSFTSLVDAAGCNKTFENASVGGIGKALLSIMTSDATIIFEGIDKASNENNRNGIPNQSLEKILRDGLYYDNNFEVDFDVSTSWIFCTAESEDGVSKSILDSFDKVVYLRPYGNKEKLKIAKKHLVKEIAGFDKIKLFDDDTLKYIIENYCFDYGVNNLKRAIERVYNKALEKDIDIKNKKFTPAQIDTILEKKRLIDSDEAFLNMMKQSSFDAASVAAIDKILFNSTKKDSTGVSEVAKSQIKLLASFLRGEDKRSAFNFEEFMDKLSTTHSGMLEEKMSLARAFSRHSRIGKGTNLLFISGPGQGKTTLIREAAAAYGMKFVKVSCNGMSDVSIIKGTPSSVKSGKPGRIISALSEVGKNSVILLDELDKITDYGIASSLLDLLDEKIFSDYYFDGITFNLASTIFVATANYESKIAPELLSRFSVVRMQPYENDMKRSILVRHILPELYKENLVSHHISFDDRAIDLLVSRSSDEPGVRTLGKNAEKVVETILLTETKHIVTEQDVINIIGTEGSSEKRIGF